MIELSHKLGKKPENFYFSKKFDPEEHLSMLHGKKAIEENAMSESELEFEYDEDAVEREGRHEEELKEISVEEKMVFRRGGLDYKHREEEDDEEGEKADSGKSKGKSKKKPTSIAPTRVMVDRGTKKDKYGADEWVVY